MRNILIRNIPDDLYYEVLKLKVEWRCKGWLEFLEKVIQKVKQ